MTRLRGMFQDQRGVAAALSLYVLVILSMMLMAFLSMAATEPQVSRNHADLTQARYVAEAGIEWGFDTLVQTADWSTVLAAGGTMVAGQTLPGLTAASGTFTVTARNDTLVGDTQLTGQPGLDPSGSATVDGNGILIVTSSGTVNGVTRQIQVVIRRLQLPPFPGAVNIPGVQADTFLSSNPFQFDGRDYNRDGSPGPAPLKYGVAVQPGVQANIAPTTYEQNTEAAFNTPPKQANVMGLDQSGSGFATGLSSIAPSPSLNPGVLAAFLSQLAAHPQTQVLQSTMACPMVMTGSGGSPTTPTLTNGCGVNRTINLGTPSDPQLIYFRGDLDPTSMFTGLRLNGTIQGAGILVVEDGDLSVNATNFRWDGIVMVVGRYVGSGFRVGSDSTLYGAFVSEETIWNEAPGFYEFLNQGASLTIRASQQNLNMVQNMRALHRILGWREL
jgi:Tfp pilus assembly protein PilX